MTTDTKAPSLREALEHVRDFIDGKVSTSPDEICAVIHAALDTRATTPTSDAAAIRAAAFEEAAGIPDLIETHAQSIHIREHQHPPGDSEQDKWAMYRIRQELTKLADAIQSTLRVKPAPDDQRNAYRNALLWAFDRLSVTGGMNANEQRRTIREIGNVLTGRTSPAATYQPNDWDDSAAAIRAAGENAK